jgi:hypothetical protein
MRFGWRPSIPTIRASTNYSSRICSHLFATGNSTLTIRFKIFIIRGYAIGIATRYLCYLLVQKFLESLVQRRRFSSRRQKNCKGKQNVL